MVSGNQIHDTYLKICIFWFVCSFSKVAGSLLHALHFTETARDGKKRILFLYVLFLCVAYINKSIYIYIYELAVEFCIFESSIII